MAAHCENVQLEREISVETGMMKESAPPFPVVDTVLKVVLLRVMAEGYTDI